MGVAWLPIVALVVIVVVVVRAIMRHQEHAAQARISPKPLPPESQSRTRHINRLDSAAEPSYQTAPLTEYSIALRERAEELFEIVSQRIDRMAKRWKGSFSIFAHSSDETAAKIVVYQSGLGHENGEWPALVDGVYVLVRCNGGVGRAIWEGDLLRSSAYHQRLDPERTIGIAPKHHERFTYFRLEPDDDTQAVAELLVLCASA